MVEVDREGPPVVMAMIMSKAWMELITTKNPESAMVGASNGMVILVSFWKGPAPSISADS